MYGAALIGRLHRARGMLALLALVLLSGCAGLPTQAQRSHSEALTDVAATPLARIAAASTPDHLRHLSGFRLLPQGDQAFDARITLARRAEKTLDVQYYLIAQDHAGHQFLRELRDAAARGVRVRLLVDDLYTAGQDELLLALAAHANVEVRLFNPLPVRAASLRARVLLSLHEFDRINRRMHNKLFITDNSFAVTGGRNIGDEYFMRAKQANFIDMDVLSSGPVVRELSDVFDRFWNSEQVFPIGSLVAQTAAAIEVRERFDALLDTFARRDAHVGSALEAQLATGHVELHYAAAQVFADAPAKAAALEPSALRATAMNSTLAALRSAQHEVLIASPYFVPGERGMAMMREAAAHNLRISVMTNSLAATDEPLAWWGYARYRPEMLKLGVTLYELSPTQRGRSRLLGDFSSSLGRLHAKVAVVDRRLLLIGSMNMDARSSRTNTEIGLLIDSHALAEEAATLLHRDSSTSNWRLRMDSSQRIEWIEHDDEEEVVHRAEPSAGWLTRLRLGLMSMFVAEDLL